MFHTKFYQNQPSGSWKEDFKIVLIYKWHGSHLGNVTRIFISLYLQAYNQNLAEHGPVAIEQM